jgi:hypothetical protein
MSVLDLSSVAVGVPNRLTWASLAEEFYEFWCSRTVNCIGELTRFIIDPLHGKVRCPLELAGDELLPAIDVVGRSGEGCVGHDVYGERGDVGR